MRTERRILDVTKHSSIGFLFLAIIFTVFSTPLSFSLGVLLGGFLAIVNFSLMYKSIRKALTPPYKIEMQPVLTKHYVSFAIMIVVISAAIICKWVHPLGLIFGLSTIVAGFMTAAFVEVLRILKF